MSQEEKARENGQRCAFTWGNEAGDAEFGMSKREFIAALIMAGVAAGTMGAGNDGQTMDKCWREHVSVDAIHSADALLLALEQMG